jgi:hypothetical protein
MRYREIDNNHSSTPIIQIGINARVKRRDNPFGSDTTRYQLKNPQGTKRMIGGDVSFFYKGFSAQLEYHYGRVFTGPTSTDYFLSTYAPLTNHFNFGALVYQLNYHIKPIKSVVSMRYDRLMTNDLGAQRPADDYYGLPNSLDFTKGYANYQTQENLSFAYVYYLRSNNIFRVDYRLRLRKDLKDYDKTGDQIRIGYQYSF